jgi:mannose-6-phosphate isomerase-like protein (cupin superfamily)
MARVEPKQADQAEEQERFQTFQIKPQLLAAGKQVTQLAGNDILKGTVMVADSGGETVVHAHQAMDQVFVVLAGEATFYKSLEEVVAVLGPMEGVLVPRGTTYWYEKTSPENLVLFRAASTAPNVDHDSPRFSEQLRPFVEPQTVEGKFFGD